MRNVCICKKKAWKKFRLVRDSNPWPLRYRCSALLPIKLTTEANWEEVIESVRYSPMKGWWWSYEYEMGALHVFNLAKTLVLIPHKKQKMPSEKGQVPEGWRSSSWGSNQIWTSTWWANYPSLVHTKFYSHHWSIPFLFTSEDNKGRVGGVGVQTDGGVLLKLSSSEKEGLLERGGLNRGFNIWLLFLLPLRCKKKSVSVVCNIAIQNVFSTLK